MPTNFPTALDTLTNPTSSDKLNTTGVVHSEQHTNANDAIEALEAKVGIDGSAVATSLEYRLTNHDHDADYDALGAAAAAVAAHEAAGDPHSQYLTAAEGNAAYQPLDTQLTDLAALAYAGNAAKIIAVNAGANGFELVAQPVGLTDGDKGDITVSASGATWTIDNDAVTYAKMQDVSATSRLLGRKTAGAGNVEELTISEALDFLSTTQGQIIYRAGASWQALVSGDRFTFLMSQGIGSDPNWASAGAVFLAQATASASATVDFTLTGWDSASFIAYLVVFDHVAPATDNVQFWMRTSTDGGTNYDAGVSDYSWALHYVGDAATTGVLNDAADSEITISNAQGNAANETMSGTLLLVDPNAVAFGHAQFHINFTTTTGEHMQITGMGRRLTAANIDAIRFMFSSGNIASGGFRLYGIPNA